MSVFIGYPSFMAYQMMKGKKGNNDGFLSIPGMIARYSALGLTNEQMKENPVWVDKTGNGHDLQMKNFAWKGMSGVGGYVQDFNYFRNNVTVDKIRIDEQNSNSIKVTILTTGIGNAIYIPKDIYQFNKSYFIKISSEGYNEGDLSLSFYASSASTATTVKVPLNPNGITEIPAIKEDDFLAVYINVGGKVGSFTVEQLPLYPGALVFDGVDDYGTCDNFPILTKEKGYTVVALRQWDQDFLNTTLTGGLLSTRNYSTGEGVAFEKIESSNKGYWNLGAGGIIDFAKSPFTWQTSKQYNNVGILKGDKNHGKPLCVGCGLSGGQQCGRFAIWELVFLDHDATEEELTKIKDYFVKTYPWLFPDQAWTVVGKTNEDEDRATIANIMGNGNNLVLSNLGFAEGSGYGSYFWNFKNFQDWNTVTEVTNSKIVLKGSASNFWGSQIVKTVGEELHIVSKVKVTGLTDEMPKLYFGKFDTGDKLQLTNGINNINKIIFAQYGWYGFGFEEAFESCNVTIEQIPEYEGYLVTDGVDDMITSSAFNMGKDFTIVGDWKFIGNKKSGTGLVKGSSFYIYNTMIGLDLYINSGSVKNSLDGIKSINAACSDGRAYDRNWNEILANTGNVVGSGGTLEVSSSGGRFDRIAFKNLAIYPRILSKDDCIKAYNYLQTLKAK